MKTRHIVFVLLAGLLGVVHAADPTVLSWYVNTDTGNDTTGDGSSGAPWKSLAKAETASNTAGENSDGDLTATGATYPGGVLIDIDCSGTATDGRVVWNVCTTSATNYIRVHGDGAYTIAAVSDTCVHISNNFMRFEDIIFRLTSTSVDYKAPVMFYGQNNASSDLRLISCQMIGPDNDTYASSGVYVYDNEANVSLNNCLIRDMGQNSLSKALRVREGKLWAYNCSVVNSYIGATVEDAPWAPYFYGKNLIVCVTDGSAYLDPGSGFILLWNSTADDATAESFDQGSDCHDNVTPTFTGNYHLAATDTTWIDGGMSLSLDSHWFDDDVDYADTSRPQGSAWDIGWHEYEQASGDSAELVVLRRRRAGD